MSEVIVERVREREAEERKRYLWTFLASVLLHLMLLGAIVVLGTSQEATAEDEIEVPIVFAEPEPEPAPPEPLPAETPPEPDEQPPEPEPEPPPEEQELLQMPSSEGEIEQPPDRPQGPEADIFAPPKPDEIEAPEEWVPEAEQTPEPIDEPPLDLPPDEPPPEEPEDAPATDPGEAEPQPSQDEPFPPPVPPDDLSGLWPDDPQEQDPDAPRPGETEPLPLPPRPAPRDPDVPIPRPREPRRIPDIDAPNEGGLFNDLQFESKELAHSDYATKLYFVLYRAWLNELYLRHRRFERHEAANRLDALEDEVVISFVIQRDGSVTGLEVRSPSSIPPLDEASQAAIVRDLLPALPEWFRKDSERVTFRFRIEFHDGPAYTGLRDPASGAPRYRRMSASELFYRRLQYGRSRGEF